MGGRFFWSANTIHTHTGAIYRKLGVTSRAEAVGGAPHWDCWMRSTRAICGSRPILEALRAQKREPEIRDARQKVLELGLAANAPSQDGVAIEPLQGHPREDRRDVVAQLSANDHSVCASRHREKVARRSLTAEPIVRRSPR